MPSNTGNSQLASADDVDTPVGKGLSTNLTSPSEDGVIKSIDSSSKHTKHKSTALKQPRKNNKNPVLQRSSSSSSNTSTDLSSSTSDSENDSSDASIEDFKKWKKQKQRRKPKTVTEQIGRSGKKSCKKQTELSSDSGECDTNPSEDSSFSDEDTGESEEESPMSQMQNLIQLQHLQQLQLQQIYPGQYGLMPRPQQCRPPVDIYSGAIGQLSQKAVVARAAKAFKALGLDRKGKKLKANKAKTFKDGKLATKLDFKRIDELWDNKLHQYKLSDTAEQEDVEGYDQYIFNVRRTFDWEGQYKSTVVDIKSKLLKETLATILEGIRGISLAEETPALPPNFLFLYLEELRTVYRELREKNKHEQKKKIKKRTAMKIAHIKILLKYLDTDYAETKKTLYPMLESGLISFEYLWALYKPGTIACTDTYSTASEPRAFKVEYAEKMQSFQRGIWYVVEGKYLEYDGKQWGLGDHQVEVPSFKGSRKIGSLACFPLKNHKNETALRWQLIERGKKFVTLQGVRYMSHEGLAYVKRRKQVVKVNINSRIMVDPAVHRRINPNYAVSSVQSKEIMDWSFGDEDDVKSDESCGCSSGDEVDETPNLTPGLGDEDSKVKTIRAFVPDTKSKNKYNVIDVELDEGGQVVRDEKLEETSIGKDKAVLGGDKRLPVFTEEEYLIASPVVLGFSFHEKQWLEFTVSGVKDITWNENAYESLVLEDSTKDIVKALVESHKNHPAQSIDDVIQGKGKGLVAVLHGPPGTGKTLTAEGISELLKCPLYMVSVGELGTDAPRLEAELQKILDIAHAWGAVLLLDEADVFLEKRTVQDIHRNALVSIFLRLLEYFQGILFLTTNRVETFDEAFQSRIHLALRYRPLTPKARKAVFKLFLDKCHDMENITSTLNNSGSPISTLEQMISPFNEADLVALARHDLNGRQIKNTVRTAQALALNKGERLGMSHLKQVLEVAISFDRDLKGGTGYEEAMRSYT